jgi:DNA-binding FadR family transcriptional regulator
MTRSMSLPPEVKLVRLAADLGDEEAERRLALWLDRMRERAAAGDEIARQVLAEWPG